MVSSTEAAEVSKFAKLNSAMKSAPCSTNVRATPDIEKKFVHRVYDAIAPHFSATRFAKWPKVASFLNSLSPGSIILDAGCGNGKYLGFNPNCLYIGCDISPPLIGICAGKGHEVLVADAVNLPYKTNFGDAAISIAVLHHLSTENRRRNAIEELIRVVRKGGLVLITVWAVEQEDSSLLSKWTPLSDKYNEAWVRPSSPRSHNSVALVLEQIPETNECCSATEISKDQNTLHGKDMLATSIFKGVQEDAVSSDSGEVETNQEYFVPWHLPYHRAEIRGTLTTEIANGLAKKDDKKGAVVYNRYYHVFVEGELQRLVAGIDNVKTVEQFYDKSNWLAAGIDNVETVEQFYMNKPRSCGFFSSAFVIPPLIKEEELFIAGCLSCAFIISKFVTDISICRSNLINRRVCLSLDQFSEPPVLLDSGIARGNGFTFLPSGESTSFNVYMKE